MPITEEEFERSAQHVQQDLHQIRANVSAFSKLASRVSTDNMVLRRSIRDACEEIQSIARSVEEKTTALGKLVGTANSKTESVRRRRQQRLLRDLSQLRKEFDQISREAKSREHNVPVADRDEADGENQGLLASDQATGEDELVLLEEGAQLDAELDQERKNAIKSINQKVSIVQDVFQDFAEMTAQQGQLLNDIDSYISAVRNDTKQGMDAVQKAAANGETSMWTIITLCILFAVAIYIVMA
ncbi:t-SNARE coiled-coil homology domain-containing protein [Plasmodiophora brassicae]|uniref:t-SNARE coiled-coil homology domain-containing protein n=1 Tax=Plasmodiophora brassicae TaxID=37360 RepID=A0A0G4IYK7_PLABS|nr:hypothetical protein PBRA_001479 [Plasmodiophora brassicae]SPQ94070.1 unnamed protein product [Plasmodiophora brassicae]